jgi:hypothetical protein
MNAQYNEEMAWRRLQDMQREMENQRLVDAGGPPARAWLSLLAERAWLLAGLAAQRPPRWRKAGAGGRAPSFMGTPPTTR